MVDARLPVEWLGSIRIDNLSDRAFRILAGALMWCNGQGTDGAIPARYTKYLHPDGEDQSAFDELEAAGIWRRTHDGYILPGWSDDLRQSTAEEVERYREGARRRQQAYRDRQRGGHSPTQITGPVTRDVTADVGTGQLRSLKRASAYATGDDSRDVTHNVASPHCAKHPDGTREPCGACARARTASEGRPRPIPSRAWDCNVDGHKLVADGTCAVCTHRPGKASVA
jgi:hypothetical protein